MMDGNGTFACLCLSVVPGQTGHDMIYRRTSSEPVIGVQESRSFLGEEILSHAGRFAESSLLG